MLETDLRYLGLTRRTAPLAVRESWHADVKEQRAWLKHLTHFVDGCMILATCERLEIYVECARSSRFDAVAFLADRLGIAADRVARYVQRMRGRDAAGQLLRVAAGLQSKIVGEHQILRQVRRAHGRSLCLGTLSPSLSALGQAAIHTGKRVRRETAIGHRDRSITRLAVEHLEQTGGLEGQTVVVLGAGCVASELAHRLALHKVARIHIVGRDVVKARTLAGKVGAAMVSLDRLAPAVARADILVVCTSAPTHLVDASVLTPHRASGLRIVDLAMPRNVDPDVQGIPRVSLIHWEEMLVDALSPSDGKEAAIEIVREELDRFMRWHRSRRAVPVIAQLLQAEAGRSAGATARNRLELHARIMRVKRELAA